MDIVENKNGLQFLEFIKLEEIQIHEFKPIAGSFAVIKCEGNYLLCYNVWRKQWELPAGQRENGETSKDCAIRELYEETGQRVADMTLKGLIKVRNAANGSIKYNPVYFAEVKELQPFVENDETSQIKLWDTVQDIGYMDTVDIKIVEFI